MRPGSATSARPSRPASRPRAAARSPSSRASPPKSEAQLEAKGHQLVDVPGRLRRLPGDPHRPRARRPDRRLRPAQGRLRDGVLRHVAVILEHTVGLNSVMSVDRVDSGKPIRRLDSARPPCRLRTRASTLADGRLSPEPLEPRALLAGSVPPGMDLAQANWFYQNTFAAPADVAAAMEWQRRLGRRRVAGGRLPRRDHRPGERLPLDGRPSRRLTLDPTENAGGAAGRADDGGQRSSSSHSPPPTWLDYTAAGALRRGAFRPRPGSLRRQCDRSLYD